MKKKTVPYLFPVAHFLLFSLHQKGLFSICVFLVLDFENLLLIFTFLC